jgi:Amt family ammonium transporter
MKMKRNLPFFVLLGAACVALIVPSTEVTTVTDVQFDTGDTAWLLMSAALVLLMTPGLAFFYGGMVRKKNVISTMLQSFICMGLVTLIWIVVGFSLAFGEDIGGVIGNPSTFFMMKGMLGNNACRRCHWLCLQCFS